MSINRNEIIGQFMMEGMLQKLNIPLKGDDPGVTPENFIEVKSCYAILNSFLTIQEICGTKRALEVLDTLNEVLQDTMKVVMK